MANEVRWKSDGESVKPLPLWQNTTDERTVDLYLPMQRRAGAGDWLVVCLAGGGYGRRSWHEGPGTALWLAMNGVAAAEVPYRTTEDLAPGERLHPAPLRDACRAVRVLRDHAEQFGLSPDRVCVLGYSAGGHLAGHVATAWDSHVDERDDLAGTVGARPDGAALIYPVISLVPPCHQGSSDHLLGKAAGFEARAALGIDRLVSERTPRSFVVHAQDDAVVPLEGALAYAGACRKAGVACDSHVFAAGGHGFGLGIDRAAPPWRDLLVAWLAGG